MCPDSVAVSYTHLDVYKRQYPGRRLCEPLGEAADTHDIGRFGQKFQFVEVLRGLSRILKAYAWTIAQVKSILKEETYIGHSVHNKQSNISFKNKKKVHPRGQRVPLRKAQ